MPVGGVTSSTKDCAGRGAGGEGASRSRRRGSPCRRPQVPSHRCRTCRPTRGSPAGLSRCRRMSSDVPAGPVIVTFHEATAEGWPYPSARVIVSATWSPFGENPGLFAAMEGWPGFGGGRRWPTGGSRLQLRRRAFWQGSHGDVRFQLRPSCRIRHAPWRRPCTVVAGVTNPPFNEEPSQVAAAFGHCPLQFFTSPPAGSKTSRDQESMRARAELALIVRVTGPATPSRSA